MNFFSKSMIFLLSILLIVSCSSGSDSAPGSDPKNEINKLNDATQEDNSEFGSACGKVKLPSGYFLNYCFRDFQRNSLPENIIYFLHGLNGRAGDMLPYLSSSSPFYDAVASDLNAPVFVSLSFGPNEVIPFESSEKLDSVEDVLNFAIPWIEREVLKYHYIPGESPNRHLVGMSLGAFNAFNVVAYKPTYFKSLTALCPALFNFDPFSTESVSSYIERNRKVVDSDLVLSSVKVIQEKIKTSENWSKRNPINHSLNSKFNNIPMFVSIGTEDEYGFAEGAEILSTQIKDRNNRFFYNPTSGSHCSFELNGLKTFFKKFIALPRARLKVD